MKLEGAIAYIRAWRQEQNLEALAPQDERESAVRLIQEKGYKLPDFVPDGQGSLQLNEGIYSMKDSVEIIKAEERRSGGAEEEFVQVLSPLPPCPPASLSLGTSRQASILV